ncbi:flagellar basal body rod protein FlgB [Aliidiomarina haloalkalitolerans]|uniref:Flagellar basal body rod protein FlgB n=1 Tax=Aliidiomarina haloalkalitolerans TaxID=859059 RepID=A0A432VSA6_9GAMM|nr:flagellar basal body rod protein FlgB [Aliidiomarina haloalkalitolerans]MCL4410812.1 flagellar basal body rod protein FlgB [Gammaproteobacteria bacterium]RUO19218.1 flagellar basal body rod protein FlgB [Aliidiomarina haloalkalitolerans]
MIDKLTGTLHFHQEALNLRHERQQVLANNIANADTPNFKARDFDFRSELERAVQQGRNTTGTGLATTQKGHIQGGKPQFTVDNLQYRNPHQARMDGNTVDMDMERSRFLDNSVRYQASLQFIDGRIKGLRTAMQSE